jgi:phospholipase C
MRFSARILVCLAVFGAALTSAQTLPTFKHIVIIVQENRTPDNLFGSGPMTIGCGTSDPFEPGVDIHDGGLSDGVIICNQPLHLKMGFDLDHTYKTGWLGMWDNGLMDGACHNPIYNPDNVQVPACPEYSYVDRPDVQPYFDIATNYGFANYFFQTNEGPSFPAHQFLLSGTSAPVPPGTDTYLNFAAENRNSYSLGCPDTAEYDEPPLVDPTGSLLLQDPPPECYEHQTLADLLDTSNISWRWYTPRPGFIWTAVNSIQHLCWNQPYPPSGTPCNTNDWLNKVIWPGKNNAPLAPGIPFLTDIDTCKLQAVSWVMPDQAWSDHPKQDKGGGPSYVANLVNEIGQSTCKDSNGQTYWQDTAIFITWDDWGGFYDHVPPPAVYRSTDPHTCDPRIFPNGWGCGYVYGFRVPLLVVSAYTPARYVSGNTVTQGGEQFPYIHDFGSILAFTEHNFGLGQIAPPNYSYADTNALDNQRGNVPLSDFFPIPANSSRSFVPITPATGFDKNYFQNYYTNTGTQPQGPDGDDAD